MDCANNAWEAAPWDASDEIADSQLKGFQQLLMQLAWHGFPDPPEWRLASRSAGKIDVPWSEWGYFAKLPQAWIIP
ncbi:hypothetical protein [Sphingobium yanoikuyae]|uniref:hypothetical protein n=1 Tax=Sphingobium yanoikuyae TaxID=13690 RepID=UPI003EFCB839